MKQRYLLKVELFVDVCVACLVVFALVDWILVEKNGVTVDKEALTVDAVAFDGEGDVIAFDVLTYVSFVVEDFSVGCVVPNLEVLGGTAFAVVDFSEIYIDMFLN